MPKYHSLETAIKLSISSPQRTRLPTNGPAARYLSEDLKEQYFEGQEGVDFLGNCMPFFLIRAGQDLNASQYQSAPRDDQSDVPFSIFDKDAEPSNTPTSSADTDSFLSSVSTSRFALGSSPITGEYGAIYGARKSCAVPYWRKILILAGAGLGAHELRSNQNGSISHKSPTVAVSKPGVTAKPIQVVIDLSQKSFMPSILTGAKQEYV